MPNRVAIVVVTAAAVLLAVAVAFRSSFRPAKPVSSPPGVAVSETPKSRVHVRQTKVGRARGDSAGLVEGRRFEARQSGVGIKSQVPPGGKIGTASTESVFVQAPPSMTTASLSDLRARYESATDVKEKVITATQMGRMGGSASVQALLALLEREQDPKAQFALIDAIAICDAAEDEAPRLAAGLRTVYAANGDQEVRSAVLDLFAQLESPASATFLSQAIGDPAATPGDKLSAGRGLVMLREANEQLVPNALFEAALNAMADAATQTQDPDQREEALLAISEAGDAGVARLEDLLKKATDPQQADLIREIIDSVKQLPVPVNPKQSPTPVPGPVVQTPQR